jgi:hypothetical protein
LDSKLQVGFKILEFEKKCAKSGIERFRNWRIEFIHTLEEPITKKINAKIENNGSLKNNQPTLAWISHKAQNHYVVNHLFLLFEKEEGFIQGKVI